MARLARIADALEQPLQVLIPASKNDSSLRGRVWELIEGRPVEKLEELYNWLSAKEQKRAPRSVALVGVRGAGKSTIGRMLAKGLKIPFVEFDAMLEKEAGSGEYLLEVIGGEQSASFKEITFRSPGHGGVI